MTRFSPERLSKRATHTHTHTHANNYGRRRQMRRGDRATLLYVSKSNNKQNRITKERALLQLYSRVLGDRNWLTETAAWIWSSFLLCALETRWLGVRKTCGIGLLYRNYRSLLEETGWLGCWLHQCVLRNTLAGSKKVVSISRTTTVHLLQLPQQLLCSLVSSPRNLNTREHLAQQS